MAYNPGVSFFIAFHELDPSNQIKCIFFTQKGARCGWDCQPSDNRRAIALHTTIIATSSEAVSLDLLREYVLCNCCRSGRARHRDRMEDIGLLIPLAQRWQEEIRKRAADQSEGTASVPALEENVLMSDSYTTPTTSTPSHTTFDTTAASTSSCQSHGQTSVNINTTLTEPVASSSSPRPGPPSPPTMMDFAFQTSESQPQHDLRSREANISIESNSTRPTLVSQAPLSEFRPHKADPFPNDDSVSWKILDPLQDRDFEPGSLYIFDRASSPGHVKIGWTAVSVSGRLRHWSKCGYKPNLLFSVHDVPHAQRVETLTHHELIKEWRRERMCKAPWCRISHQEWFEVSKERAAQVLGAWAYFMKTAQPYDYSQGVLRTQWREVIEMMDEIGEVVTAKKLLELYDASLVEDATLVEKREDPEHVPAIEDLMDFGNRLGVGHLDDPKEALLDQGLLRVEQPTSSRDTPMLESEALPTQIPPVEVPFLQAEEEFRSNPLSKEEPLSKTEPLFKIEPLPTSQLLFTAEPPFKVEPLRKTGPPSAAESLLETEPPTNTEPTHEVLAAERTPVEEVLSPEQILLPSSPLLQSTPFPQDTLSPQETPPEQIPLPSLPLLLSTTSPQNTLSSQEILPEQIPLPSSPLLQSTTFPNDTIPSQEINPSPSAQIEGSGTPDVITHSSANIPVVGTSASLGIVLSVSSPAPVPFSAVTPTSAASTEGDIPERNFQTSTDTSTAINSPPLDFPAPSPSSEPSPSDLAPTSASPRRGPEAAEPTFEAPARLGLVPDISKTLLLSPDPSTAKQAENRETPPPSPTRPQQNFFEDNRQAEPTANKLLGSDDDGPTHDDDKNIMAHDPDENTASATTEDDEPGAGSEASTNETDAEETLVEEDQQQHTPKSLEETVSKIVDELCNEMSTGKASEFLYGTDDENINAHDPEESTATTEDHEPDAGAEASTNEWDPEERLVEEDQYQQIPKSLTEAVSKIANGLCNEFPTGNASALPQILGSDDEETVNDHHHHHTASASATATPEADGEGTDTLASDADADTSSWHDLEDEEETLVEIEIQQDDPKQHTPSSSSVAAASSKRLNILDDVDALCSEFSTLRIAEAEANGLLLKEGLEEELKTQSETKMKIVGSESEALPPPPPPRLAAASSKLILDVVSGPGPLRDETSPATMTTTTTEIADGILKEVEGLMILEAESEALPPLPPPAAAGVVGVQA